MRIARSIPAKFLLLLTSGATMVLLGLVGCGRSSVESATRREAPAPKVTVVVAGKRNVPFIRTPNATTNTLNNVTIRARVRGFLKEKHFDEGSNVKKDQLLLVIDEEPYKVRVAQNRALLEEARSELQKAEESKAREVAKAQVALAETQLQLDRVEERRERTLLNRKASSQEDYDRAKARAEKSVAQVQAATAALQQALADYDINILSAKAKVEKALADLRESEIDLSYCRMHSPLDGRAGELQVKLGNLVGPAVGGADTTSLVTVQQLDPMGVDIRPASRYLPTITQMVKSGLEVSVRLQGEKRQRTHQYKGKILFVDNTIDPTTSTVLVKASVPNPDETILPGEYVKVDLNIGDYVGVIAVPEAAVIESQEGSRVLIVGPDNKVQTQVVKPLDQYQGLVILSSGLEEGQKVVVKGIQLARPGQVVDAVESDLGAYVRPEDGSLEEDPSSSPLLRIRGAEVPDTTGTPSTPPQEPPVSGPESPPAPEQAPPASSKGTGG